MVPSGALGSVWAMKSTLFPQSSTRALPLCFCLWLHLKKNHQDLPVLWLGSPLEFLLIFPSHLAPITTGVFSLWHCSASFCCFPVSMALQMSCCHQPVLSDFLGSWALCFCPFHPILFTFSCTCWPFVCLLIALRERERERDLNSFL